MHIYQIITLYTLNLHNIKSQFYLNKAGKEKKKRHMIARFNE